MMTSKAPTVVCCLCGGDGYTSAETAANYGRHYGDTTCPSCDGKGKVISRPSKVTVNDRLMFMMGKAKGRGVVLVRGNGESTYYVGLGYLWTSDRGDAFPIPDRKTAQALLDEFPVLEGCRIEER
jgi:hypothetical protein